jgi:hypothetical protein
MLLPHNLCIAACVADATGSYPTLCPIISRMPACPQAAAAAGAAGLPGGVGGGSIDTRKRLVDFPEGAAIADLERCAAHGRLVLQTCPVLLGHGSHPNTVRSIKFEQA